jgi:hypothetical protein
MPPGVSVHKFALNGIDLEISGTLSSVALLPSLMQNLKSTDLFIDVSTASVVLYQSEDDPVADSPEEATLEDSSELPADIDPMPAEDPDSADSFSEADPLDSEASPDGTSLPVSVENDTSSGVIIYAIGCRLKGSALK